MAKSFFVFLLLLVSTCVILIFVSLFLPRKNTTSKIFDDRLPPVKELKTSTLILVGDVMLGRTVMTKSFDENDTDYPFAKIASELASADITFVNLENPIISDCPIHTDGFKFCTVPTMVDGLTASGIDVVTLANNHSGNYSEIGVQETISHLASVGILATGVDNLVVKSIGTTTFGFLGFNFTFGDPDNVIELISESNKKVDVLIVAVHWGEEYKMTANSHQQVWARKMVEAGADVIAGSHPHWVQDVDYIGGKPVYYSLGNLVFDQMWSEETRKGMIVKLTFDKGKVVSEERLQTYMSNWAQPEIVDRLITEF